MNEGVVFPSHYPSGCPPSAAEEAAGVVFRITKGNPPNPDDFLSFHEMGKALQRDTVEARCQYRGLSVFRSLTDASHHLQALPGLGDYIAKGTLTPAKGKTQLTATRKRPTHTTWWCAEGIDRGEGFAVI
jgi:hypothetical protein